jgi:hypothetical protein
MPEREKFKGNAMKVCVCDVCQTTEKLSTSGLFLLKGDQIEIDICGTCAVNVLATMLADLIPEATEAIRRLAKDKIPVKPATPRPVKPVQPIDDDLEKFIAESTKVIAKSQTSEKERIDFLTDKYGQQVFIEQFGSSQRIGSTVKLGMPGRKTARKVEVVEPVEGKPDHYYVFQIKE